VAVLVVVMLGLGSWVALRQPGPANGEPGRLVALDTTSDLGRVPFDRAVEGRFVLENTGGSPVRIVAKPAVRSLEGC
jgi:hypothetical protein